MTRAEQAIQPPGELLPKGRFGHLGDAAIFKSKEPGWTPFRYDRAGDDAILTGAVEARYKNGKPKWPKPHSQIVVTLAEIADAEKRYEADNERCCSCFGRGQRWVGWSAAEGHRYGPCDRCHGSGLPPERAP